jgi:zinc protease
MRLPEAGSTWRLAPVAVALIGLGACIVRPTESRSVSVIQDQSRRLQLANGLQVVLEMTPALGAAATVLVVGAGSADDPIGKAGLAHLTEHLACEANHGTIPFFDRAVDGTASAGTSWDATTFRTGDDLGSLEESLSFLQGLLKDPLAGVDDGVFRQEWSAVANERRFRTETGTPGEALGWLMADTFPDHDPYAHSPVGTAESLPGLTLADARAFTAAHYRPGTSTLLVAAPLPLDEQQALVERVTGQSARLISDAPISRINPRPTALQPRPHSFREHDGEVAAPILWVGWSVPSDFGTHGELAHLLVAAIRNGGPDLEERDPDVGELWAGVTTGVAADLLYVGVALKSGLHPERTAALVADEAIAGLGTEFEALKRFASTEHVYAEESLRTRTLDDAWSASTLGSPSYLRGLGERMLTPSREEAVAYADTFLGKDRAHVVLVRPGSVPLAAAAPSPGLAPLPTPASPSAAEMLAKAAPSL